MKLLLRPITASSVVGPLRPLRVQRSYATHHDLGKKSTASRRRAVTPFNDNGFVPWSELSVAEKASRATQQSFNFGVIVVGLVLTGSVGYFLYQDVFSPDSKTAYYNRVVDRIKKDPSCLAVLGEAKKITAHDAQGTDHLIMHFYVEGPLNNGVVNVHLVKRAGHSEFEYKYLFVDVKGHQRIYLENADAKAARGDSKNFHGIHLKKLKESLWITDQYLAISDWSLLYVGRRRDAVSPSLPRGIGALERARYVSWFRAAVPFRDNAELRIITTSYIA
ncbi:hypothetical protein CIB48_g4676 [Xylaria polymorpha]|nr:hypothetical protein CIB48_g4676 [Xylaria polymorpha]